MQETGTGPMAPKPSLQAIRPESGYHFRDSSDDPVLTRRIVSPEPEVRASEKPDPLFRAMR
jgi:hypothetical protein